MVGIKLGDMGKQHPVATTAKMMANHSFDQSMPAPVSNRIRMSCESCAELDLVKEGESSLGSLGKPASLTQLQLGFCFLGGRELGLGLGLG